MLQLRIVVSRRCEFVSESTRVNVGGVGAGDMAGSGAGLVLDDLRLNRTMWCTGVSIAAVRAGRRDDARAVDTEAVHHPTNRLGNLDEVAAVRHDVN